MDQFISITKALADETRVRILLSLRREPLCVCQIIELCDLAASTISRHMAVLKHAGLVRSQKKGRWVYYSLPGDDAPPLVHNTIAWVRQSLSRNRTIARDAAALRDILNEDPEDICRRQTGRCCPVEADAEATSA